MQKLSPYKIQPEIADTETQVTNNGKFGTPPYPCPKCPKLAPALKAGLLCENPLKGLHQVWLRPISYQPL
jgi:hypothetical protein